jgi:peroxiredoxin
MQATRVSGNPRIDEPAPDSGLTLVDGRPVNLSSFWSAAPNGALVVFMRHFGCIFCREQAKLLRDAYQQFNERGVSIVTVGLGTPEDAEGFASWLKLPYPVLGHPDPEIHAEWGLGKASAVSMVNPGLVTSGFRALKTGSIQGKPTGDPKQLPGMFLVDRTGIVRWARPGQHPGDNPPVEDVLAAIDGVIRQPAG